MATFRHLKLPNIDIRRQRWKVRQCSQLGGVVGDATVQDADSGDGLDRRDAPWAQRLGLSCPDALLDAVAEISVDMAPVLEGAFQDGFGHSVEQVADAVVH